MATSAISKHKAPQNKGADNFEAVAKRLECDEDKARFEKKLGKLAKAKAGGPSNAGRRKK